MKKKGISLISLIVTVIVILLLAVAIIFSLVKSNPIENAKWAKFSNNYIKMDIQN